MRGTRFTDSGRRRTIVDNVHAGVIGRLVHAGDLIVVEVRLIHHTVGRGNLAAAGDAGPENCCALKLRAHGFRVHNRCGPQKVRAVGNRAPVTSVDTALRIPLGRRTLLTNCHCGPNPQRLMYPSEIDS